MSTRPPANRPVTVPWGERPDDAHPEPAASPRSQRDLDILHALARRINPRDAGAHNNLGVVYYNKGLYDDAVRHFEHALDIDPRMQVAERNLQIAYFGTGYFERLVAALNARLAADPHDVEARDQLARAYYNSGDLAGAVRELRLLLAARPADAPVHQRLARAELKRGDLDAAIVALRRAEELDPQNARVQFMIGEVLYQRGVSNEARVPLERAIVLDERLADAYHLLAFVYGDLGETEKANRTAARAAELNPSYAKAEAGLSIDSYSTKRYNELIGDRGADAAPRVAEGGELAHYNLGLAFRQKALYDEALREFRLATERGEDTFLVRQAEAEMLLLRGDSAESLALYQQLTQQEAMSPKLWNELGVSHHQTGSLVEAEQAYRRALEVDPHYALAWNNLGVARHHRAQPDAEAAFRSAVREPSVPADVWRNFALMLHRDGRRDESEAAYERALQLNPGAAHAETGYGVLLLELGRADEARTHLLRAVEAEPRLAEARYHLAFALSAIGDYQGALRETKLALELNPYIPTPRFRLLIDLQFEEASVLAPELDSAAHVAGGDSIAAFHFQAGALDNVFTGTALAGPQPDAQSPGDEMLLAAHAALERGLLEQALTEAQRAGMYGAPRIEVLLLQGEIYLRRNFSGEAVERFYEALGEIAGAGSADTDDALRRALLGAARSLLDLGRLPEAVEAAERVCALAEDNVDALRTLGEALARVQDHARAAIVLERARLHAPNDVALLTQLGAAYAAAGDPDGAESALRRAITLEPRAVAARATLASVLVEDRPQEAEAEYREALRVLPTYSDAAFGLAGLYEADGRARDAIHVMVDLLTMDPYQLDALVRLGQLLRASGMHNEARFAFERVLRFDPNDARARAELAHRELAPV
ncbi:MAG TPA: tetratricopeptide repeat protein [Longimicrobiales bacterium]|nr:tetratricopeptide repeat protein [Longimicrobiales bacterium]